MESTQRLYPTHTLNDRLQVLIQLLYNYIEPKQQTVNTSYKENTIKEEIPLFIH